MKKILLIGPLPQPITGLSISNEQVLKTFQKSYKIESINTSTKYFFENLGKFNFLNVFNFCIKYTLIYKLLFSNIVYYTPGQTFFGLIKYAPFIVFSKILGKELIIHVHGNFVYEQYNLLSGFKKKVFYALIKLNDKGIVLSSSLRHNLADFMPNNKIFVLPNFYNSAITKGNAKKSFKKLKVCYLSNLMIEKGVIVLLDALASLNKQGIDFRAEFAGHIDKSNEELILNKISKIKGASYIGVVTGEKKRKLLQNSNIFILPTFYKMEGLPISIIEAMATGNVIISTDHAAISDLVKDGRNGFLVKKKSSQAISQKLIFISKNPTKASEMSSNNIDKTKNNYKSEEFSKNIIKIIEA